MLPGPIADRPVAFDIVLDFVIPRTLGEVTPKTTDGDYNYWFGLVTDCFCKLIQ